MWMVKTPHPKAAVHSRDKHDGREDDETADEEARHRLETAERKHDWPSFFPSLRVFTFKQNLDRLLSLSTGSISVIDVHLLNIISCQTIHQEVGLRPVSGDSHLQPSFSQLGVLFFFSLLKVDAVKHKWFSICACEESNPCRPGYYDDLDDADEDKDERGTGHVCPELGVDLFGVLQREQRERNQKKAISSFTSAYSSSLGCISSAETGIQSLQVVSSPLDGAKRTGGH